ncbi:hypothetical protein PVAP13_9NG570414 [Panicum virgatum]|uniref:Uncharacterized protein n=1 Tax=Panicum virgatum TaxID=38727 RepID=A0A8T0MZN8_PANVG|nr:hypothetical protein PVAP13_9NG570414 [Panicum virgatum]
MPQAARAAAAGITFRRDGERAGAARSAPRRGPRRRLWWRLAVAAMAAFIDGGDPARTLSLLSPSAGLPPCAGRCSLGGLRRRGASGPCAATARGDHGVRRLGRGAPQRRQPRRGRRRLRRGPQRRGNNGGAIGGAGVFGEQPEPAELAVTAEEQGRSGSSCSRRRGVTRVGLHHIGR